MRIKWNKNVFFEIQHLTVDKIQGHIKRHFGRNKFRNV